MSTPSTDLRAAGAGTPTHRVSPIVVVAAIVALVFIAMGALVATEFAPPGKDTAVVTGFVLGTIAPTIVGLLALIRGDHAAQVGAANATRLVEATAKVEQVAKDVNGHLARHDTLAESLASVAETIGAASGVAVTMPRDTASRTRATDTGTPAAPASASAPADAPPRSDQT